MIISISGKLKSGKDTVSDIIQGLIAWKKSPIKDNYIEDVMLSLKNKTYNSDVSGFYIKKFADELKDTICRWINCTREQLEDHEFKNTPLGEEWWYYEFDGGLKINYLSAAYENGKEPLQYLVKPTPRLLMQLLGTEAGRNILHPNLWINILFSKYKPLALPIIKQIIEENKKLGLHEAKKQYELGFRPNKNVEEYPNWIITDNRFLNEIQAIKKHQGITIRVERDLKLRHSYNTLEEMQDKNHELYKVVTHPGETELDNYEEFDYIIYNNGSLEELIEQVKQILEKENLL